MMVRTTRVYTCYREPGTSIEREAAKSIDENAKILKAWMKPLLNGWLLPRDGSLVSPDPDFQELRETFLPDVIIAYAATLQFAGTTNTRDYLLECMELAAIIAAEHSDTVRLFEESGRIEELLRSFASASKALAIWTSDQKKGAGTTSKRMREMGWSREIWSVKPKNG
jgi:nuclear pore complex protein Nup107